MPERAMAGIGLWYPDARDGIDPVFREFMHGGTCDGTARHYAHIPMYRPSSTRAEMYAILASLYSRTPVRLGLDNLPAVRGMNKLLASDGGEGARPWGLARDGDLWCKITAILRARGVQSFAINKLKGHCDRNMIDNGTFRCVTTSGMTTLTGEPKKAGSPLAPSSASARGSINLLTGMLDSWPNFGT